MAKAVQTCVITVRLFPSNLTALVFGYSAKSSFSDTEQSIAKPTKADFCKTRAKAVGVAAGVVE